MSIRLPLQGIVFSDNSTELGAASVAGGVVIPFTIPQDTDNIVVKFSASVAGTGISAVVQTTDDGGTTWYDVGRTSIVSNTIGGAQAEWLSIPVISAGLTVSVTESVNSSVVSGGSNSIGSAAASTLGQKSMSGMPILSPTGRVFLRINGNITSAAANLIQTRVSANSQGARQ